MSKLPVVGGMIAAGILAVVLVLRVNALPATDATLIAHEWGTFTALQDDDGTALGAINADDEPVPRFVCTNGAPALSARSELTQNLRGGGKGIEACHPDVTLRLETPVIYFYPPVQGRTAPVNVHVTFRGGWLTEYYPWAVFAAPDLDWTRGQYPPLTAAARGSLAWNRLELNAPGELIATDDPVWTAPRAVARAAAVKAAPATDGRTYPPNCPEKFLFYRGVGHLNSPLRVVRDVNTDRLSLHADRSAMQSPESSAAAPADLRAPAAWLLEIRAQDGFCAFRPVPGAMDLRAPAGQALATLPASFSPGEFGAGRLQELRAAMHAALVADGLFPDEAAAMLKTWELSYFKSPGRRLFYVTPRAWTEQVLPLSIDGATITRAMIGRIELVTPAQRASLARVAAGPCPDLREFSQKCRDGLSAAYQAWNRRVAAKDETAIAGTWKEPTLAEMRIPVPVIYQEYLDLGRFRDALVLDEQKRHPTAALAAFIAGNALQAPRPVSLTLSSFLPDHENPR